MSSSALITGKTRAEILELAMAVEHMLGSPAIPVPGRRRRHRGSVWRTAMVSLEECLRDSIRLIRLAADSMPREEFQRLMQGCPLLLNELELKQAELPGTGSTVRVVRRKA